MTSSILRLVRGSAASSQWGPRTRLGIRATGARILPSRNTLQTLTRGYASTRAPIPEAPIPKKRFKFLRYMWKAAWYSGIAGVAFLGYSIYESRHPQEQYEPDPSKKTLVILGTYGFNTTYIPARSGSDCQLEAHR